MTINLVFIISLIKYFIAAFSIIITASFGYWIIDIDHCDQKFEKQYKPLVAHLITKWEIESCGVWGKVFGIPTLYCPLISCPDLDQTRKKVNFMAPTRTDPTVFYPIQTGPKPFISSTEITRFRTTTNL